MEKIEGWKRRNFPSTTTENGGIEESVKEEIIRETVEDLREELHQDGSWYVDYVRIRIKAVKK